MEKPKTQMPIGAYKALGVPQNDSCLRTSNHDNKYVEKTDIPQETLCGEIEKPRGRGIVMEKEEKKKTIEEEEEEEEEKKKKKKKKKKKRKRR
ncbi:hypothetical protein M8J76_009160 [Diaphorina citri]|nr:hypothetical protein M8J75_010016 [Diaphorina citri]KAI5723649.1 hypothetical protein M8J76_009160 [Diaphorina citri]KAI5727381.1 hypothetical protein M8J77_001560 [Diaphorina citri]